MLYLRIVISFRHRLFPHKTLFYRFQRFCHIDALQLKEHHKVNEYGEGKGKQQRVQVALWIDMHVEGNHINLDV